MSLATPTKNKGKAMFLSPKTYGQCAEGRYLTAIERKRVES